MKVIMMENNKFQVIYDADKKDSQKTYWLWEEEAFAMQAKGILVSTKPDPDSKRLMFRGRINLIKDKYRSDDRFINQYQHFLKYAFMSRYIPLIADLSIETFFVEELNKKVIEQIIERGWKNAFIKKDIKSLEYIGDGKSIWPDTGLEEMRKLYIESGIEGKYAIRKFVDKDVFDQEERYWVFNGNIYHRNNKVPDVVKEAAKRLNILGSHYYTIDATPEFVVEVNPGESSDRHAVNSAELFASWIKKEFVR